MSIQNIERIYEIFKSEFKNMFSSTRNGILEIKERGYITSNEKTNSLRIIHWPIKNEPIIESDFEIIGYVHTMPNIVNSHYTNPSNLVEDFNIAIEKFIPVYVIHSSGIFVIIPELDKDSNKIKVKEVKQLDTKGWYI